MQKNNKKQNVKNKKYRNICSQKNLQTKKTGLQNVLFNINIAGRSNTFPFVGYKLVHVYTVADHAVTNCNCSKVNTPAKIE